MRFQDLPPSRAVVNCPCGPVTAELEADARSLLATRQAAGMRAPVFNWAWIGFAGEIVLNDYLRASGITVTHGTHDPTFDMLAPAGRIEIKTRRGPTPLYEHYDHNVHGYQTAYQQPDLYLFVYVEWPKDGNALTWWLAGGCTRQTVMEKAVYTKSGLYDNAPKNVIPGYRIAQKHLTPLSDLIDAWKVPA